MIDKWAMRRKLKIAFKFCLDDLKEKAQENRMKNFIQKFYDQGLKRRAMKGFKLFSLFAGNKLYERK